ncbi:MAG: flagellar basal body-associated FliL family protein [Gracilibacteraceae bacterium]|jgi:flagellar FliL protein|nr:flagellar basal body-associated FliL family protein [Gracilibacteraceae bacterium]
MKKLLPIVLLIIGIGFGVGGMLMKEMLYPPEIEVKYSPREPDEVGPMVEVGEITANLRGGGMIKTEIVMEGVNSKSAKTMESRLVFVRDRVYQIFISHGYEDISSAAGQEDLRGEILEHVNEMLGDQVKQVLFSSLIFTR